MNDLPVTAPCGESWSEMVGSRRTRQCAHCDKSVHDLSTMRISEVAALIAQPTPPCVRYRFNPQTGHVDMPVASAETAAQVMAAGLYDAFRPTSEQRSLAMSGLAAAIRRAFGGK